MCAAHRLKKPGETHRCRQDPDTGMEFERRRRWFVTTLRAGCVIFWFFSLFTFLTEGTLRFYIPLFFAVLTTTWVILMMIYKGASFLAWSTRLFTFALMVLMSYYLMLGGQGNALALWSNAFPMIAIFVLGRIEGGIWTGLFVIVHLAIAQNPELPFSGPAYSAAFLTRYFLSLTLVIVMTYCFELGRIRAEKTLRRNQQLLATSENRLRHAYEELKTTQSQLVQTAKLASIGELASGVAHELNQPLMVIRGNAQLVERRLLKQHDLSTQQLTKFIDTATRNTKRMSNIINHLRSFSRHSSTEFASVSVGSIINDTFLMIGEQLRLRGVNVIRLFSKETPIVKGNANQLEQVFLNLMSNAADAFESKSWRNSKKRRSKRLIIVTRAKAGNAGQVEILFRDNGEGIPPEHLDTIFDPFFTTKETGKGTGLGLSISYGIIKNHARKIEVMKTNPRGTTFRILLPAAKQKTRDAVLVDDSPTGDGVDPSPPDADTPDARKDLDTAIRHPGEKHVTSLG